MTACGIDLESFLSDYIRTALWSSHDDNDDNLDANYTDDDIHPDTLAKMREDCAAFLAHRNGGRLIEITERLEAEGKFCCPARDHDIAGYAAHDLWLTRNGHGAGFWEDGDWPKGMGKALDDVAKEMGTFDLYVGDDGLIYGG